MPPDEIVLYRSIATRSHTARWMLEELGVPYRMHDLDIRRGDHKSPEYLALNPMGKVPALAIGDAFVTEVPAICLFLADRYSYGALAPKIESPERGAYLRWCVFATAVVEPALLLRAETLQTPGKSLAWGSLDDVVRTIIDLFHHRDYVLGDRFSAADVVLGAQIAVAMYNKQLTPEAALVAYHERLTARPAFQRASKINWPPELFPGS